MNILAIDPGPVESAIVLWDGGSVLHADQLFNDLLRFQLRTKWLPVDVWACEMVACYGMPVGAETFDTCLQIGRFQEIRSLQNVVSPSLRLVFRREVKMHLCGSMRAKDSNIRQALLDRFGPVGTKNNKGKLYGISSHRWAALAVAVTVGDNPGNT